MTFIDETPVDVRILSNILRKGNRKSGFFGSFTPKQYILIIACSGLDYLKMQGNSHILVRFWLFVLCLGDVAYSLVLELSKDAGNAIDHVGKGYRSTYSCSEITQKLHTYFSVLQNSSLKKCLDKRTSH